jgi:hypothetical protein
MSVRRPARHPGQKRHVPRRVSVTHCTILWKYSWAGAATPTQPNTTRPQEPPRRASDVINSTNVLGKDNPWPTGKAAETIKVASAGTWVLRGPAPVQRGPALPNTAISDRPAAAARAALRTAAAAIGAWLTSIPRRAGGRLFRKNDQEASWWGWQVTELAGGLARQYRDAHFDTLRDLLDQHRGLVEQDPRPGGLPGCHVPGVPEAWDDHWNGAISPEDDPRNPRTGYPRRAFPPMGGSTPPISPQEGDG